MANAFQRTTPVVLNLLIINVLVWIAQLSLDKSHTPLTDILALYPYNSGLFKPFQLITHMFAHASYDADGSVIFSHILLNMFALWMFGSILESVWGGKRFLIFYLACGLAAGLTQLFLSNSSAIGASGAIMGLIAAFGYLFPQTEFFVMPFPFPIKAKYMVILYAAYDIFGEFHGGDNIAHLAHLGGLVMGFTLVIIWNRTNKKNFY